MHAIRLLVPIGCILVLVRIVDIGKAFRLLAGVEPLRLATMLVWFGMDPDPVLRSVAPYARPARSVASSDRNAPQALQDQDVREPSLPTMAGDDKD
jgi:hypothetical protein